MMNKKQFVESQKECASMMGMSLSEYQSYCENLKVPSETKKNISKNENGNTNKLLKSLGIDNSKLKTRNDY